MSTDKNLEENIEKDETIPIPAWVYDKSGLVAERSRLVIVEKPITLYLNGREMVTLLCAGHHLDELSVGFFHAEGFIESREDLESVQVDLEAGKVEIQAKTESEMLDRVWMKRTVTSGCGKGSLFYYALDALLSKPVQSDITFKASQLLERVEDLNRLSETYRQTHGVHNTALALPERIVLFRDDIGRHNAVDMIVGHVFLNDIPLDDKILLTTGRLTSEMLIKAAKVNIPVIVSRNVATTLAVELAKSLNITLIGFSRAGKFTVYSCRERIVDSL